VVGELPLILDVGAVGTRPVLDELSTMVNGLSLSCRPKWASSGLLSINSTCEVVSLTERSTSTTTPAAQRVRFAEVVDAFGLQAA